MTKVIHVHLIREKKNYYFGSIEAVYDELDADTVGMKKSSLAHSGLTDGVHIITSRAIIIQSYLRRSKKK